jgi:hypothetical protein
MCVEGGPVGWIWQLDQAIQQQLTAAIARLACMMHNQEILTA